MLIKFKKETKEGVGKFFNLIYYGVPLMLCAHSGMASLFGSHHFIVDNLISSDLFVMSGAIVLLQMGIYNRDRIFLWIKEWKKRNVKDGILEI